MQSKVKLVTHKDFRVFKDCRVFKVLQSKDKQAMHKVCKVFKDCRV